MEDILALGTSLVDRLKYFMDPENSVAELRGELATVRRSLETDDAAARQRALELGAERDRLAAKLTALQAFYVRQALPVMATYDQESMRKTLCEEIKNTAGTQEDAVKAMMANELKTYGYRSRFLHTLDVTIGALRRKAESGAAFDVELSALSFAMSELGEGTVDALTKPLEALARRGVATRDDLAASLRAVVPSTTAPAPLPTLAAEAAAAIPPLDATAGHRVLRWVRDAALLPVPPSMPLAQSVVPLTEATDRAARMVREGNAAGAVQVLRSSAADTVSGLAFERWCRQATEHASVQALLTVAETRLVVERYGMVHFLVAEGGPLK